MAESTIHKTLRQVSFTEIENQLVRKPNVDHLLKFIGQLPFVVKDKKGDIDYVATTKLMQSCMEGVLLKTPLYHYEQMEQQSGTTNTWMKHENIQRLGDIAIRAFVSIIFGNAIIQGVEGKPKSISIGLCSTNYSSSRYLADICFAASEMKTEVNIFVSPIQLSLFDIHSLYICKEVGAKIHWAITSNEACCSVPCSGCENCKFVMESAQKYAKTHGGVFIDPAFDRALAILGISTCAAEIIDQRPETTVIVCPYRNRTTGWSTIAGISLYCATLSRQLLDRHEEPVRVVAANMTGDSVSYDKKGNQFRISESSFNDYKADLYLRNKTPKASADVAFEAWESELSGVITESDIVNVLIGLGCPIKEQIHAFVSGDNERKIIDSVPEKVTNAERAHEKLGLILGVPTDADFFLYEALHLKDIPSMDAPLDLATFQAHLDCQRMIREWNGSRAYSDLSCQVTLNALKYQGLISEIVSVNDDEVTAAFMDCLAQSHTHASGRGASALAALYSDKIKFKNNECAVALISGGTVEARAFSSQLDKGLALQGLLHKVKIVVGDNNAALTRVFNILSDHQCSIIDVVIEHGTPINSESEIIIEFFAPSRHEIFKVQNEFALIASEVSPMIAEPAPVVAPTFSFPEAKGTPYQYQTPHKSLDDVTPETIKEAYHRLTDNGILNKTPIYRSEIYSKEAGCDVYLMLENLQKTGSFKCRGASNMLLKAVEASKRDGCPPPAGVIACSAGNAGFGTAHAAQKLGIPCTIVCPTYAPKTKVDKIRNCGAEVILHGTFEDAAKLSRQLCEERGWILIHPYDAFDVVEGQGTIGYELDEALPDIDTVLVNVGGGGMISGIATYLRKIRAARGGKPLRVVGLQAEAVSPLCQIKETGKLRFIDPHAQTIADGVNVKIPGSERIDPALFNLVDEWVPVPENQIAATITHMMSSTRTLVEGAGCLGIAAILYDLVKFRPDEKVAVVVCGGSVDLNRFAQLNEFGLRALGRTLTFDCIIEDKAGQLSQIIKIANECNVAIREIQHRRYADEVVWTSTIVEISVWVNSFDTQIRFLNRLIRECNILPKIIGRTQVPYAERHYSEVDASAQKSIEHHNEHTREAQAAFDAAEAKKRRV